MTTTTPSGLDLLRDEMARQHADALASFQGAAAIAARVVESARATGQLLLLGMGASHAVNRVAASVYRNAGIEAIALTASEMLLTPLPARPRTTLLTSQSGGSGEILQYLRERGQDEHEYGVTLDPDSELARARPSLVGSGGAEHAFAATRSLSITLALCAAVADAAGADQSELVEVLVNPESIAVDQAIETLAACRSFVVSGQGASQGVAEAGALGLMELARLPAMPLETGQFRHGPLEMLGPAVGVIMVRDGDDAGDTTSRLAETCVSAGSPTVVLDASGQRPLPATIPLVFPERRHFAAAMTLLPPLQRIMIGIARRHVDRVGEPIRSTKVTV